MSPSDRIHLVGSVPLPDCEQVFRRLSGTLGPYLSRIPDGETGERARWIYFQRTMLEQHPAIELDPTVPKLRLTQWDGKLLRETPLLRFKPGIDPEGVAFETGYDAAARNSYAVFRRLRDDGVIPAGVRFQVALPTPVASGYMYVSPKARETYLRVYERALLKALAGIVTAIPALDFSIQIDVCQEVLIFENYFPERPADYKEQIIAGLERLGNAVPNGVELGFHLCYGSPYDEHLVQPRDAGILAELMNGIAAALKRRLDFVHIPVPRPRHDEAYFAPLRSWAQRPETRLYLGLLHHNDPDGDAARIATARRFVADFGVASECGWGRTDPARLEGLLAGHRAAAQAPGW